MRFDWDNVEVADEILIGGFEVSGAVQSAEENAPVSGVDFFLYTSSDSKVHGLKLTCSTAGLSGTSIFLYLWR